MNTVKNIEPFLKRKKVIKYKFNLYEKNIFADKQNKNFPKI